MRTALRWSVTLGALGFGYLAYVYLTLPDVRPLVTENPETTAFIQLRQREAAAEGRELGLRHTWVPYGRISGQLKRAVLVTEDAAFWDHEGLDYDEIRASLEVNLAERRFVRGASTITQQLAKNLYLSPSRNPVRKLREVAITRRLEAELSKQRIFEIYLNVIEWGDGIFGCEAAARAYFGKSASALTAAESALLAGAIINPRVHSPARPTGRLRARQQIILRRMGGTPPPDARPVVLPSEDLLREDVADEVPPADEVAPIVPPPDVLPPPDPTAPTAPPPGPEAPPPDPARSVQDPPLAPAPKPPAPPVKRPPDDRGNSSAGRVVVESREQSWSISS